MTGNGGDFGSKGLVGAIDIGQLGAALGPEQRGHELCALLDSRHITRLGEGVDRTRRLDANAAERTLFCCKYAAEPPSAA